MAIRFEPDGDILHTCHQTVVCPVNTVGVMGKGLALAMSKLYRGLLFNYRKACMKGELDIGKVWVHHHNDYQQILCFPSKKHWRDPSDLKWIDSALKDIAMHWRTLKITSIALPKVGCGEGGLDWKDVCPLIIKYLDPLPIQVVVFGEDTRQGYRE